MLTLLTKEFTHSNVPKQQTYLTNNPQERGFCVSMEMQDECLLKIGLFSIDQSGLF